MREWWPRIAVWVAVMIGGFLLGRAIFGGAP